MFALIYAGSIVQIEPAEFDVNSAMTWVDISAVTPAPQVGWSAVETNGAWSFVAPVVAPVNFAPLAQAALDKSDVTVIRCFEHGVAVPSDWTAYRAVLRAIVAGTSVVSELPVAPAYPVGT